MGKFLFLLRFLGYNYQGLVVLVVAPPQLQAGFIVRSRLSTMSTCQHGRFAFFLPGKRKAATVKMGPETISALDWEPWGGLHALRCFKPIGDLCDWRPTPPMILWFNAVFCSKALDDASGPMMGKSWSRPAGVIFPLDTLQTRSWVIQHRCLFFGGKHVEHGEHV